MCVPSGWQCRFAGSVFRSVQRLDGCDRDQVLHGIGEVPVEGDQRVGVQLGQGDVLGVKSVWPPEQGGGFPCDLQNSMQSRELRFGPACRLPQVRGSGRPSPALGHLGDAGEMITL
jgi:hypothetical protein